MFRKNKGQAAMEFLMTYGWAILVVLAAIGALAYFGVLSPDNLLPERCAGPPGLDCLEKASLDASADTIELAFKNNLGQTITLTGVEATSCGDADCAAYSADAGAAMISLDGATAVDISTAPDMRYGVTAILTLDCGVSVVPNDIEGRTSEDFTLVYDSEAGLTQKAGFSIKGRAS